MTDQRLAQSSCSVARSLGVLGERWTFLILREALSGTTRFADFRTRLGVAADVLSDRLATLVDAGVMVREAYQEPGSRSRYAYHLTDAGRELELVLGSLQQWGDRHLPRPEGATIQRRAVPTGRPVRVAFVDDAGSVVDPAQVAAVRTSAYPSS